MPGLLALEIAFLPYVFECLIVSKIRPNPSYYRRRRVEPNLYDARGSMGLALASFSTGA
jgi:hypothetical protein